MEISEASVNHSAFADVIVKIKYWFVIINSIGDPNYSKYKWKTAVTVCLFDTFRI